MQRRAPTLRKDPVQFCRRFVPHSEFQGSNSRASQSQNSLQIGHFVTSDPTGALGSGDQTRLTRASKSKEWPEIALLTQTTPRRRGCEADENYNAVAPQILTNGVDVEIGFPVVNGPNVVGLIATPNL